MRDKTDVNGPIGFTLIELLIVVAIIAILAAIAVPNFLEAQTRSKVARTLADMRTLLVGIESYHVDNNRYPPRNCGDFNGKIPQLEYAPLDTRAYDIGRITTPVSFLTSLPADVFEQKVDAPNNLIEYWDEKQTRWFITPVGRGGVCLISVGPDGYYGIATNSTGYPPEQITTRGSFRIPYDTTNGTISVGNIHKFSHNSSPNAGEMLELNWSGGGNW